MDLPRVECPECRGTRWQGLSPCSRCGGAGDLPEDESFVRTMAAAVRGGCPWCSEGPGKDHGDGCRKLGKVPALEEQPHQPEYRGPKPAA